MQNERKENEVSKRNLSISRWTGGLGGRVALTLTPPVTKTGCLVFIVYDFQVFESLSLNLSVEWSESEININSSLAPLSLWA